MNRRMETTAVRCCKAFAVHFAMVAGLGLFTAMAATALPKIYVHTKMEKASEDKTIITHLVLSNKINPSGAAVKVRPNLPSIEYVYPQGADISYAGTIYPFDDKDIWFNRSQTIAAINLKPVADICELYLIISTRGGLLVLPDCDARVGAICRSHNKQYELGWLRVDSIKGRVVTVESGKASLSNKITHVRLYISHDGQFRLLSYWRTKPSD